MVVLSCGPVFAATSGLVLTWLLFGPHLVGCAYEKRAPIGELPKAAQGLSRTEAQAVVNRYIVMLKEGVVAEGVPGRGLAEVAASLEKQYAAKLVRIYGHALQGMVLDVPPAAVDALKKDDRVALIEQDQYGSVTSAHSGASQLPSRTNTE